MFYCNLLQRSAEGSSAEDGEGKQNTISCLFGGSSVS